jgi:AraC-like DNA-binding protein
MKLPNILNFDEPKSLFSIEYVKRTEKSSMQTDHFHPQYEIYYLLSGERYYFIEDRSYHVQPGDLVFINKNVLHKTMDAAIADHERVVIYFHEAALRQAYDAHSELLLSPFSQESALYRYNVQDKIKLESLVSTLLKEMKNKAPGYELSLTHTVIDLMLFTGRHVEAQGTGSLPMDTPFHQKISDIIRFINHHYGEPMSLARLAEQFYISPYYLSRMFKDTSGFTLTEYLNAVRVKEAQALLRDSKMKITDIAASVGFDNFSHFGKVFKKIAHVSPRAYRRG